MDVNGLQPNGHTKLYDAVYQNDTEQVMDLLEKGADPDAENSSGWTPLMNACARSNFEMYVILTQHGADPKRMFKGMGEIWKNGCMHAAIQHEQPRMFAHLVDIGIKPETEHRSIEVVWLACQAKLLDVVREICEKGVDENDKREFLQSAVFRKAWEIARYMVDRCDWTDEDTVCWAIHNKCPIDLFESIVRLKRRPYCLYSNSSEEGGALFTTVGHNGPDYLAIMLQNGEDPNKLRKDGGTALHAHVNRTFYSWSDNKIGDLLIRYGTNPHTLNKKGKTAYSLRGGGSVVERISRSSVGEHPVQVERKEVARLLNEPLIPDLIDIVQNFLSVETPEPGLLSAKRRRLNP